MTDGQQGEASGMAPGKTVVRRKSGYAATGVGTSVGGLLGLAAGQVAGLPLAAYVLRHMDTSSDAEDWIEALLETIVLAIAAVIMAALVFIVAIIVTLWLGTVIGCWVALRVTGNDRAGRTALFAGCLGPPIAYALLWVTQTLFGSASEVNSYVLYGIGVTLISLAARHLATRP